MALELNGTTGVSLVQDGVVTAADLASGAITSAALPTGSVLQVVTTQNSSQYTRTTSGWYDATNYAVQITPTSSSSKFLIMNDCWAYQTTTTHLSFNVKRTTATGGDVQVTTISDQGLGNIRSYANGLQGSSSILFLDSPSTTETITYTPQFNNRDGSGTSYFGAADRLGNTIVMEIAG